MKVFPCNRCNTPRQGLSRCAKCGSYEFRILYLPNSDGQEKDSQKDEPGKETSQKGG